MVYGRLVDPDGDFFIGRAWHHHPPWRPGSALHGGPVDDFSKDIGGAAAQREWLSLFYLRPEAVPNTVLSLDTARRVLFAGRASRVLLRGGRWSAAPAGGGPDLAAIQDDVDALLGCFGAMSPPCVAERAVERIRARVSEKLRRLVVEEAGLAQHLAALKGFCLLGHGAFYQTLLEAARPLLRRPPPPHAEAELAQGPWATAVAELETGEGCKAFAHTQLHLNPQLARQLALAQGHIAFAHTQPHLNHGDEEREWLPEGGRAPRSFLLERSLRSGAPAR
ncbi:unnamed protein product [Prorocentrum cordatum]|uniref:Spindle pole body component n=1 Tax=Prorocentrum cordatum TaxID=2364126 RepID=A0ABN9TUZ2_9DINO|nr:unnamed protein product [Polarella glacialis]